MTAKSHVTQREAEAVCAYAIELMTALHMPMWTIQVSVDPAEDDANASIRWLDQRYVATVYLGANWMKLSNEDRRMCVTHEVLHLLHAKVSTVVLDDSEGYMHDHEHGDWSRRVRRELELMVDHLAGWMSRTHSLEQAWDVAHGKVS